MKNDKIVIDAELKTLMPQLAKEEFEQLERNILEHGCRDALVLWGDILIDGYNRYDICRKYNLPYTTKQISLKNREEAKRWIILNQLGRRNLNAYQRSVLALELKDIIAKEAEVHQKAGKNLSPNSAEGEEGIDTREQLAAIADVSHDTISKTEFIQQNAPEQLKTQLVSGDISINKAYQQLKKIADPKKTETTNNNEDPNTELSPFLKEAVSTLGRIQKAFTRSRKKLTSDNQTILQKLSSLCEHFFKTTPQEVKPVAVKPAVKIIPNKKFDIQICRDVLLDAIIKGGTAALSELAQKDTSNLALLIKAVKLSFGKQLKVESSTNMLASQFHIPINKEKGIINNPRQFLVPAKELLHWIQEQEDNAIIEITYSETPLSPKTDDNIAAVDELYIIKQAGVIELGSKSSMGINNTWQLVCYDLEQRNSVDHHDTSAKKLFDINVQELKTAFHKVEFAAPATDREKVLDNIVMQTCNGQLYIFTTDMTRVSIRNVSADIYADTNILIPVKTVRSVLKSLEPEVSLAFSYYETYGKSSDQLNAWVYINHPNLNIRVAVADKSLTNKIPNITVLMEKEYKHLTVMTKAALQKELGKIVTVDANAMFKFKKGSNAMTIMSDPCKDITRQCGQKTVKVVVSKIDQDCCYKMNAAALLQAIKVIKSDKIQLLISDDMKSIKVVGDDDSNYSYYAMTIKEPKTAK